MIAKNISCTADSPIKAVANAVAYKLRQILSPFNKGEEKAVLPNLRHGVGKMPGEDPKLWGILFAELPETMMGKYRDPSREEWAIYTALTLFAVHQQGKDPIKQPMHKPGCSLGAAVSRLVKSEDDRPRVARRFNAMATSNSMEELSHHLRGIIQILRDESIPVDYVDLATDLYRYQNPNTMANVRLAWGQDFYRKNSTQNEGKDDDSRE